MARGPVLYDLLRLAPSLESTEETREVLVLVSSLLSQLIVYASNQLQRIFIGSLNRFAEAESDNEAQVLANILQACVKLSRHNGKGEVLWERTFQSYD